MINALPHATTITLVVLFAALAGSVINMLVYRYPIMIHADEKTAHTPFNLFWPPSHCPHCNTRLRLYHLIPLISYLCLRGRSHCCRTPIGRRYIGVEITCVALCLLALWRQPNHVIGTSILTCYLIALTVIDFQHKLLPDGLTLTGLWLGLLISLSSWPTTPVQAILGAAGAYSIMWLVGQSYLWCRGRIGLGQGDYKMLAMLGAWLGISQIFNALLIGVCIALLYAGILLLRGRIKSHQEIPLGPFLAIGGLITLYFGTQISSAFI